MILKINGPEGLKGGAYGIIGLVSADRLVWILEINFGVSHE